METSKNRIAFIDLAKGLCIMLVMWHHTASTFGLVSYPLKMGLSSFRMPLYFFLSGLFFKAYSGFLEFFQRKVNKLLVPFIFFFLTTSCLLPIGLYHLNLRGAPPSDVWVSFFFKENFPNIPIWFLLGLFLANVIFYVLYFLSKKLGKGKENIFLCGTSIGVGALGCVLGKLQINLPMFLDSAMISIPYFLVGYIVFRCTKLLKPNNLDRFNLPLALILLGIPLVFCVEATQYHATKISFSILLMYVFGLSGTFGVLFLSKRIHKLPLVSYLGRYSIIILLTHGWILWALVKVYYEFKIPISQGLALGLIYSITILSYLIFIPVFKNLLPWFCAQKNLIPVKTSASELLPKPVLSKVISKT